MPLAATVGFVFEEPIRYGARGTSRLAIVWLRLETAVGHWPFDGLALLIRSGDSLKFRCIAIICLAVSSSSTFVVFVVSLIAY